MQRNKEQILKEISSVEDAIASFVGTYGSPVGCGMRTLTLQSMYNLLDRLKAELSGV